MKALFLLIPFLAVSCATKRVLPASPPPVARLAAPAVETIRRPIDSAVAGNTVLKVSNAKLASAVKSARTAADETQKAVSQIQPGQAVTQESADALKRATSESRAQIIQLSDLVSDQFRVIDSQAIELAAARQATDLAVTAAALKDTESEALRSYAVSRDIALTSTLEQNDKLTKQAAANAVYKRWVLGVAIAAILAGALIFGLKSIKPL